MPRRRLTALELSGERARLRRHRPEDAPAAFALLAGQEAILRWLLWDGPESEEELASYYGGTRARELDGDSLHLALEERATGALAGSFSLRFSGQPGQGDVGYWVGLPFQGRGLGREALDLVAHLAFRHLKANALSASVFVGNTVSRHLLERCGFTLVRTAPGRSKKGGERIEEWHFVLLAREWRRLRAGFAPLGETVTWEEVPDATDVGEFLSRESEASAGDSPTPGTAEG